MSKPSRRSILTIIETLPTSEELLPQLLAACTKHGEALGRFDGVWRWSFGVRAGLDSDPPVVVTVLELQDLSGHSVYNKSAAHKHFLKAVEPLVTAPRQFMVIGDVQQYDMVPPQD